VSGGWTGEEVIQVGNEQGKVLGLKNWWESEVGKNGVEKIQEA